MTAFDDLREGLGQAWDNLVEGWRDGAYILALDRLTAAMRGRGWIRDEG